MGKKQDKSDLKNRKYYQTSEKIIDKIAAGEWKTGEKIPPEAELCEMFGVSRVTLRESLKMLSILGVLDIIQGDGSYVSEINTSSFIDPLLPLLRCNSGNIMEIYTARIVVEAGCCGLAARNRTEEEVDALEALIEEMEEAASGGELERYTAADTAFHSCITKSCGQPILISICNIFSKLIVYYAAAINQNQKAVVASLHDHKRIFNAIRDKRDEYARVMMGDHLRASMNYLLRHMNNNSDPK